MGEIKNKCPDCGMSMQGSRCEECAGSYELIAAVVVGLIALTGIVMWVLV